MTGATSEGIVTVNPATGERLAFHPFTAESAFDPLLARAQSGFRSWRAKSLTARLDLLHHFAAALRENREKLARQATLEMGKPITAARGEIDKCADMIGWYVENSPKLLADKPMKAPSGRAYLTYQPLGTILGVMPWNFPYWQILRAAIPIMASGNGFLVKPAENTFGCGELLHDLAAGIGLGDAFLVANLTREQSARAIADDRIAAVTLTGSIQAGRSVAASAGKAVKKSLLELGGCDPFIVLADADLEKAAATAVASRFGNCGQVCIAAKRLIVEESVLDAFTELFLAKARALQPSDPLQEDTSLGPMARIDLRDGLHEQVRKTVAEGASLLLGGEKIDRPGAWYQPTVLGGVRPGMTAFKDELFGPVASLIAARDTDHAIELANDSAYGLSASLWTQDHMLADDLAKRIEAGGVFINRMSASDPHLPIGGVKASGYGRELTELGLHEFVNIKTVWAD
ncbi:NAD-dependent succinate-semialdehyde dehydrogenase [Kozakia baliensis]|uniref:NAD-dependent succinate-semialdehyde dehydrogenase n=1 Tax=Kozakia baliensis TaxID=153496 RepID=UPI00345C61D5